MGASEQAAPAAAPDEDGMLLAASAAGRQDAFASLLQRHYRPVYRVAWRMMNGQAEAEDVAQEAFLKLWQNPGQVREPNWYNLYAKAFSPVPNPPENLMPTSR